MRTIAIMNNKGGVGKTVTAINLADILVRDYLQRVVLVDCDGQANLTRFFLPDFDPSETPGVTTAGVLTGACESVWSDNLVPIRDGLSLLCGSAELYELDLRAVRDGLSAPENLEGFAKSAEADNGADWMIFDCPPGYTVASVAALLSAAEVVIPVTADAFSLDGASAVMSQIWTIRRTRPQVSAMALLTQARTADVVTEGERLLRCMGVGMYRTHIRRTDKVPESTLSLQPLREYSPGSSAARDYKAWAAELMGGV